MPTTITAVFQDGVLKPTRKLKLRPNEKVKLNILRQDQAVESANLGPMAGAFPGLAVLTDKDIATGKRLWEQGLTRQTRRLDRKRRHHGENVAVDRSFSLLSPRQTSPSRSRSPR